MKSSCHWYLRNDGSLGRFPIVELAPDGTITSVCECEPTLTELPSTRFAAGVMVPGLIAWGRCDRTLQAMGYVHAIDLPGSNPAPQWTDRDSFCRTMHSLTAGRARLSGTYPRLGAIEPGAQPGLVLLQGIDLNTFAPCRYTAKPLLP